MRGIPVWGEVEFAWRFLPNIIVGVTGTNGKTTTTELLGHIIAAAGRPCRVAGNVGVALSSLVGEVDEDEVLVVELSSFQLEDSIDFRPDVAILLNLAEDHLDRHPDLRKLFRRQAADFREPAARGRLHHQPGRPQLPASCARARIAGLVQPQRRRRQAGRRANQAEPLVFMRTASSARTCAGSMSPARPEVASAGRLRRQAAKMCRAGWRRSYSRQE